MSSKFLGVLGVLIALAGCSALPATGPSASAVVDSSVRDGETRYVLFDLNDQVIRALARRVEPMTLASFGDNRGAFDPRVGVGDVISVTIWEAGAGGLFTSSSTVIPGARAAPIPEQMVGRDGSIVVPYVGRVSAAGRTTYEIQRSIERQLEGKAIQPQALVNIVKPIANTVTVLGEATGAGRLPLSPRGDRVLDVIATAGGTKAPVSETVVQLTRAGRSARVPLTKIASSPRENIYVRPGDVLTVLRDPMTFTVYGATGRSAQVAFESESVTLAQAIAKAGGLLDSRANPEGVFVFRMENAAIPKTLGADYATAMTQGRVKTVYRLDMRDPNGMFLASQFKVASGDLVYVSNSAYTEAQKILQLFGLLTSPTLTSMRIANGID